MTAEQGVNVLILSIISEREFGVIFSARIEGDHPSAGETIRIRALNKVLLGRPSPGETWQAHGEIADTPWGRQMDATGARRVIPSGRLICDFLAANVIGVGRARAARLWERYGIGLDAVLSDESRSAELALVLAPGRPYLAPALAIACIRAWRTAKASTQLLLWLSDRGVEDVAVVRRLLKILGEQAVPHLERNPYLLVPLLPWAAVDRLGTKLLAEQGVEKPREDSRRLVGAVDAAVKSLIQVGSTASQAEAFTELVAQKIRRDASASVVSMAMTEGIRQGAILTGNGLYRAPGCATMEDDVARRLHTLLQDATSPIHIPSVEDLVSELRQMEFGGRNLHEEQVLATARLLQQPLGCLQGGAGVGKTTTLQAVCDIWASLGGNLVLCAIAGKAALKLSRATHRLAMTVARLLMQLSERERIERELSEPEDGTDVDACQIRLADLAAFTPETMLIVDEASMVDLPSFHELLRRLPTGARLLLVGDDAQLPPVGFGLVYHKLVDDAAITARLTVVHRQSEASGIPTVAAAIRRGKVPELPDYVGRGEGVYWCNAPPESIVTAIQQVWDDLGGRQSGNLIVTATRSGVAGVRNLNSTLQRRRAEVTELAVIKGVWSYWYSPGDPVVWLRNDYARGLFNGMLGAVTRVDPESRSLSVAFEGEDEVREFSEMDFVDLALAYAISAHRAQGSQAPAVIIPLYRSRVLDPSWLYTAVTRAERQVVLVGERSILGEAVNRTWSAHRRVVGFQWPAESRLLLQEHLLSEQGKD